MYYLNIDVPHDMVKSWFNLCFLDSLVMILSTEITTVHQAPFKEPTSDPVCSDYLDNRRSGTRVALDRFHWCCQAYLSLSISRLDLSYSPLFDYKYAPLPGKG